MGFVTAIILTKTFWKAHDACWKAGTKAQLMLIISTFCYPLSIFFFRLPYNSAQDISYNNSLCICDVCGSRVAKGALFLRTSIKPHLIVHRETVRQSTNIEAVHHICNLVTLCKKRFSCTLPNQWLRQLRVPGSLVASPFIVHLQQLLKAGACTTHKLKVSKDCSPRCLLCTVCCSSASVTHDSTAECIQQSILFV